MSKIQCKKHDDGFNYIKMFISNGKKVYEFDALIKTGSEATIVYAADIGCCLAH